jgi:hypothetical protein
VLEYVEARDHVEPPCFERKRQRAAAHQRKSVPPARLRQRHRTRVEADHMSDLGARRQADGRQSGAAAHVEGGESTTSTERPAQPPCRETPHPDGPPVLRLDLGKPREVGGIVDHQAGARHDANPASCARRTAR